MFDNINAILEGRKDMPEIPFVVEFKLTNILMVAGIVLCFALIFLFISKSVK